jgi:hypothetical protein
MTSVCHSVVRAPAARVTRLGPCGELPDAESDGCDFATTESFVDITLTKVLQDRQDALQLNANGDICVDKPKAPILRWYEVVITFCNVDPELFNIVSAEPLVLNDAASPEAIGWCTLPDSPASSNFALEFWTGTDDDACDDDDVTYGYGILPRIVQGMIGDVTIQNGNINFTVSGITRGANQWGVGPYNVIINETGANAGLPGPLLTSMNPASHKCFFWTLLPPPVGSCGCQDLTQALIVTPLTGLASVLRTLTFPLGPDGDPVLPAIIDWGDLTADQVVTSGTNATHTYVAGSYVVTYRGTGASGITYTSATVTVT